MSYAVGCIVAEREVLCNQLHIGQAGKPGGEVNADTMATDALTGSCLCGEVRFEIKPPFAKFAHCHCRRCRKATGAAHSTNIYLTPAQFSWVSGPDSVLQFDLPTAASFSLWFCRHCGCPVPRLSRSRKTIVVPAGALDDQPVDRPKARIFCGSEAPWVCSDDTVPRFTEYPNWW